MQVTAKTKDGDKEIGPITIEVGIPETLKELVAAYGEDAVANAAIDALVITVQAGMRRMMVDKRDKDGKVKEAAKKAEEIQAAFKEWKPDTRTIVRQTAFERASSALDKLSPEERAKLLQSLQAMTKKPA